MKGNKFSLFCDTKSMEFIQNILVRLLRIMTNDTFDYKSLKPSDYLRQKWRSKLSVYTKI